MKLARLTWMACSCSALLWAQNPDKGDPARAGATDPFTGGEPKAMQAAGIVAYGPFPWANQQRTEDVDKVLGTNRLVWIETAHFLIGCSLAGAAMPEEPEARKFVNAELQRLNKRWSKFPPRASKLDPWLRLHLYALRAEELYAEFAKLVGHDDASGTHLGQKGKFALLLLQKKSDLVRYHDRFCASKSEMSQRHYYDKTGQYGFVLTPEGDEVRDEASVHAQFRYFLIEIFADAKGGMPFWLSMGLAHWYERQVSTRTILAPIKNDESVDASVQHLWHDKMKARCKHEGNLLPFHELATKTDLGYYGHLQAWSRVDWMMAQERSKLQEFLAGLQGGHGISRQIEGLERAFGLESEAFDATWRAWVLKTYK